MLPSRYTEFILVALIAILVVDVNSQGIIFNDWYTPTSPNPPACDSESYCTPLQRCQPLRRLPNWRTVGIRCGFGQGAFRRVCCPLTNELPPVRPPVTPTPTPTVLNLGCGTLPAAIGRQVMGGQNAAEGAWPWMVAITMRESSGIYTQWCTGFLIDRRHVLSAAHCFDRRDVSLYQARIGRVNQLEGEMYRISRIAVPPGYRTRMYYDDIAILTLDREVTTPGYNAICLPNAELSQRNLAGYGTSVAGWGATSRNGTLSIILQQLERMPIVDNQECNRIFREMVNFNRQFPRGINSGFICAGFAEGERDPCGGDSGGPLMFQDRNIWYAIGIVSFGYSCGLPGIPGGYTRISQYLDWIAENTND